MIPAYVANWALSKSKRSEEVAHASAGAVSVAPKKRKRKERVLQSKGGSGALTQQRSPREEAEARDWEAQQQANRDKADREEREAKEAQEAADELAKWQGRRTNAYAAAENYGRQKLSSYGLDTNDQYGIWQAFVNQLTQNNNSLADNQDFSSALSNSVFDNILSDTRSSTRNKYARDFENELGSDYLDTTFANTIDDSILDAILGDQYTGAQTSLKNAMDRGQMSQSAYDRAISSLGTKKTAARGELETTGRGAISGLRSEVSTAYDNSKSKANNFDFGDTYDYKSEAQKIRDKSTDALSRLDSAVRQAVGDKQFFDANSIIQGAVAAGGASNYTGASGAGVGGSGGQNNGQSNLSAVFSDQERKKQTEGMF